MVESNIKVSIIIPAWHEETVIESTLQALKKLNYSLKKCEVIVVASADDNTYNLTKKQDMDEFNRYLVLKQESGGKNTALQQGIKKSVGKFIVFLDADTIVDRNWLTELIKPIKSNKFVCSNGNYFPLAKCWLNKYFMIEKVWQREIIKQQSTHGKGGIAIRKDIINKIGLNVLFNKKIHVGVDHYFGEQILKSEYKVCFVQKARTKTYFNKTFKGFIKDQLRWKKGYFRLINKKRFFTILIFNSAIIFFFIIFLLVFIPFNWFYHKFSLSFPFFIYLFCSFIKCATVSNITSNINFIFYFPSYIFLELINKLLTCNVFLSKMAGFNTKKEIHFKGERC